MENTADPNSTLKDVKTLHATGTTLAATIFPMVKSQLMNKHAVFKDITRVIFFVDYKRRVIDTTIIGPATDTGLEMKAQGQPVGIDEEAQNVNFITSLMEARIKWDKIFFARVVADFSSMVMDAEAFYERDGKPFKKTEKNIL